MALGPGTRLGAYEILTLLGSGGMGEVYRAKDAKLGRDVAVKVLPASFGADPDRLARFEREARLLASLNHPHIAAIYGVEEDAGMTALVLELVEGETLEARLKGSGSSAERASSRALGLGDALAIARQIADALEAAHEQGIIHRDLKPANIKVRDDGTVKVLDFGLAKAVEAGGGGYASRAGAPLVTASPTITTPAMTLAGVILGTAAYMSPEQAKGRPADKRSDVWAFGCVLFEMLAGRRAFEGDDVSDTLALVLRGEPDWGALPPGVPAPIRELIKGCLERDRRQRVGDIAAARFVLRDSFVVVPAATGATMQPPPRRRWRRAAPFAIAIVAVGALGVIAGRAREPVAPPPQVTRFAITLPAGQRLSEVGGQIIAISPDGSHIAYIANQRIYLRAMSDLESRPIAGTETGDRLTNVMFSPDGQSIAFWVSSSGAGPLKRVPLRGGTAVTLGQLSTYGIDTTWHDNGVVFAERGKGIARLTAAGQQPLAAVTEGIVARPQILPDGDTLLFAVAPGVMEPAFAPPDTWDKAKIVVQSLKSGERKTLIDGGGAPSYVPTGHLLYVVGGTVFAVPFDYRRRQLTGGAVPVIEGVGRPVFTTAASPAVYYRVADNGTLIYVPGPAGSSIGQFDIAYIDAKEQIQRLKLPPAGYVFPRLSPNGKRLAVEADDSRGANVWVYDLSGASAMRQLTLGGKNRYPVWSGDGNKVAFQSDREGDLAVFAQQADGNSRAERLTKPESGATHIPESWSRDGRTLLYSVSKGGDFELWGLSMPEKKSFRFGDVRSSLDPTSAAFSPDGQWVAYLTTQNDTRTLFVERFPPNGVKHAIGTGIWHPVWSPDGRRLFYRATGGREYVVRVTTEPAFSIAKADAIAATGFQTRGRVEREYDVTGDGRFIAIVTAGQGASATGAAEPATAQQINVVVNWTEELKQRVPTK